MPWRVVLVALAALALAVAPVVTPVALADDGAPSAPPSFRPPDAVLRQVSVPTAPPLGAAPAAALPPKRELVVFVGGYQTCACSEPALPDYAKRAVEAGYEVMSFGQDPRFPYDTYGSVDASGRNLRDQIRSVASGYGAVHIVTHSMGGVVADRAFAQGLSSGDGVVTYTSLSAPHSGSDAARAITLLELLGPREPIRRIASFAGVETRSDALRDLASVRPIAAPAGVVRLDLRAASDLVVTDRDARDPGVASRILDVRGEGHDAITHDAAAIDLAMRTIATHRVPPDERSQRAIDGAARTAALFGLGVVLFLLLGGLYLAFRRFGPGGTLILDTIGGLLPAPRRRPCP